MKATIVFPGPWKVSKQASYLAGRFGRKYKNPAYCAEMSRMLIAMHPQLIAQGWHCTKELVALKIVFHGPRMPCDWDNCGILTDAMQGPTTLIGGKRMRGPGPVVWDDRQFIPTTVDWVESEDRKIVVEIKERGKQNGMA
jgi:hypothetical protein